MRKILMVLLALMLLSGAVYAEAPAMTLEEERLIVLPSYGEGRFGAVYIGRIRNTGNAALTLKEGTFELKDKDGGVLASQTWMNVLPSVIQPGEDAYVIQEEHPETATAADTIASHTLDLKASTEASYRQVTRLPAEASIQPPDDPEYGQSTLYAVVRNDSGRELYDITVVFILRDDQGQLLFGTTTTVYNAALPVDGQLKVRNMLDGLFEDYIQSGEAAIGKIEAFAYVEEYAGL